MRLFQIMPESGERHLPDPLKKIGEHPVTSSEEWENGRREEVFRLLEEHIYGTAPISRPEHLSFEVDETQKAMNGKAVRKQVRIRLEGPGGSGVIRLLLFVPSNAAKHPAVFLLINNRGAEHMDPTRSIQSPFWPAESIVSRGFAAAVFDYADADPDYDDGFHNGVHALFDPPGKERPKDAWGAIAAWAWAASRAMDYFETDPDIDASKTIVVGHSRGGKASLWAGAADRRFAMVVSNDSGCTGAAVSRRKTGETIAQINGQFPHWFNENYKSYNDKEDELPVDQHMLTSLIAPRHLYVASATEDGWADPESEFLGLKFAVPVYQLYGIQGIANEPMPSPEKPLIMEGMGYHLRTGGHDLTEYDWQRFMDYAQRFL
jgi:dienelactone hydrolase